MQKLASVFALAVVGLVASSAAADETKTARKGETTLDPITISVKRARPLVAATVARVPMESTMARLKTPLVDRIEAAAGREPF